MPQFDPSVFSTQLFWLVVTFVVLYFALSRLALPRVAAVLEARQSKVDDDLDRAAASKQEADSVLAEYEKALADGSAQAQGILRQSADDMAAEAAKRQATLGDKLAEEVKAAEARIVDAKEAAVGNISQVATEVAQAAARRLIDLDVGAPAAEASVKAVLEAKG